MWADRWSDGATRTEMEQRMNDELYRVMELRLFPSREVRGTPKGFKVSKHNDEPINNATCSMKIFLSLLRQNRQASAQRPERQKTEEGTDVLENV
jgi:hypothetical protein